MEHYDLDLQSIQEARDLARQGEAAAKQLAGFTADQIDRILKNMVRAASEHAFRLARMAVEETGYGVMEDKAFKNHAASTLLYEEIKDMKTVGIIGEDTAKGIIEVAAPVGLIMGIIPSTNPTSTTIFKALIAVKSGNAIVFSPHPSASKCTIEAARLMQQAAAEAGAPEGTIGCVRNVTMAATGELMKCREISMIIATGGPGMVKAAYSAGKPAIGVGAGNSPAYIEKSADIAKAVSTIIASKTFDNGTICASEQSVICETCNQDAVIAEFKKQGGYFMTAEETTKVCSLLFRNGHTMNARFVGRKAGEIADAAGFCVPAGTKVLLGRQDGAGPEYPLSYEKLTTVLAFYTVPDWQAACKLSYDLLEHGMGHTMSLHTGNRDMVLKFAVKPASRILINTGGSQGGTGISTGLPISFTLGCGTCGGSSASENISPLQLINVKKVAYGLKDCIGLAEQDQEFQKLRTGTNTGSSDTGGSYAQDDVAALVREIILAMKNQ